MAVVIGTSSFGDRGVGQVHIFIGDLFGVVRKLFSTKTTEAESVDPNFQRLVRSDQNVHPQIEFLTTNEVGVVNVT